MDYEDLLSRHQASMDEFVDSYFHDSQEFEKIDELDLIKISDAAYIPKEMYVEFLKLQDMIKKEHKEYLLKNVYEVVVYQCWNYGIAESSMYSYHDLIYKILGFTATEFNDHVDEITKAISDYRREFYNSC